MAVAERRKHPRLPFEMPVELEWGASALAASTADLSLGGMFIRYNPPLWVGALFHARVFTRQPLELECVVRRVVAREGMGVAFQNLSERARERLAALLEELESN